MSQQQVEEVHRANQQQFQNFQSLFMRPSAPPSSYSQTPNYAHGFGNVYPSPASSFVDSCMPGHLSPAPGYMNLPVRPPSHLPGYVNTTSHPSPASGSTNTAGHLSPAPGYINLPVRPPSHLPGYMKTTGPPSPAPGYMKLPARPPSHLPGYMNPPGCPPRMSFHMLDNRQTHHSRDSAGHYATSYSAEPDPSGRCSPNMGQSSSASQTVGDTLHDPTAYGSDEVPQLNHLFEPGTVRCHEVHEGSSASSTVEESKNDNSTVPSSSIDYTAKSPERKDEAIAPNGSRSLSQPELLRGHNIAHGPAIELPGAKQDDFSSMVQHSSARSCTNGSDCKESLNPKRKSSIGSFDVVKKSKSNVSFDQVLLVDHPASIPDRKEAPNPNRKSSTGSFDAVKKSKSSDEPIGEESPEAAVEELNQDLRVQQEMPSISREDGVCMRTGVCPWSLPGDPKKLLDKALNDAKKTIGEYGSFQVSLSKDNRYTSTFDRRSFGCFASEEWYSARTFIICRSAMTIPESFMFITPEENPCEQKITEKTKDIVWVHPAHEDHWIMVHLSIGSWQMIYFDSRLQNVADKDRSMINFANRAMNDLRMRQNIDHVELPQSSPAVFRESRIPQTNDHSSGPLILREIERLLGACVRDDEDPVRIRVRHLSMVNEAMKVALANGPDSQAVVSRLHFTKESCVTTADCANALKKASTEESHLMLVSHTCASPELQPSYMSTETSSSYTPRLSRRQSRANERSEFLSPGSSVERRKRAPEEEKDLRLKNRFSMMKELEWSLKESPLKTRARPSYEDYYKTPLLEFENGDASTVGSDSPEDGPKPLISAEDTNMDASFILESSDREERHSIKTEE